MQKENSEIMQKENVENFRDLALVIKGVIEISDKYPEMKKNQEIKQICKNLQYELNKIL